MRAYRLHDSSWARIVTHRVRRPNLVAARLRSRRRRDYPVPVDGQLVLLNGNHRVDPRSGAVVDRRELLDRLVEALSVNEVDGVVGTADLLEELTLLNVMERRLAVCAGPGEEFGRSRDMIARSGFDAARIATSGSDTSRLASELAALQVSATPALVELVQDPHSTVAEFDTRWQDWLGPLEQASRAVSTGAGVWFTLPPINGMTSLAAQMAFPVLVRDTDVPIAASAWSAFFARELPLTVRGIVAGRSALFPLDGSVAEATEEIATAVRRRVEGPRSMRPATAVAG